MYELYSVGDNGKILRNSLKCLGQPNPTELAEFLKIHYNVSLRKLVGVFFNNKSLVTFAFPQSVMLHDTIHN